MKEWELNYTKRLAEAKHEKDSEKQAIKDAVNLLWDVALKKQKIDSYFNTQPATTTFDDIYELIKDDPYYKNKLTRIDQDYFLCDGYDKPIHKKTLRDGLDIKVKSYLSPFDKVLMTFVVFIICAILYGVIKGVFLIFAFIVDAI